MEREEQDSPGLCHWAQGSGGHILGEGSWGKQWASQPGLLSQLLLPRGHLESSGSHLQTPNGVGEGDLQLIHRDPWS